MMTIYKGKCMKIWMIYDLLQKDKYGAKVLILQREQLNQRRNPFY